MSTPNTLNTSNTQSQSTSTAPSLFDSLSSMPISKLLADYIAAAASGSRPSLLYLVVAIFTSAKATVKCLTAHFESIPYWVVAKDLARLKRCAARLEAIIYTLRHAPGRFLAPSQLRQLTRARAILAHIWAQPVDFSPLMPLLAPSTPSSTSGMKKSRQGRKNLAQDGNPGETSRNIDEVPPGTTEIPPAHPAPSPLLLRTPGRALATVLIQLGRIYGIRPSPIPQASPLNPQSPIPGPVGPHNPQSTSARSEQSQISNFKSQIDGNDSSFITHHSSFPSSSLPSLHPVPG